MGVFRHQEQDTGCAGHWWGEHWGWPGVQLGSLPYLCGLKTPPLRWHLSFPSPPETLSSKCLGEGWGRPGRERRSILVVSLAWQHGCSAVRECNGCNWSTLHSCPWKKGFQTRLIVTYSTNKSLIFQLRSKRTGLGGSSVLVSTCSFYNFYCCSPSEHSQPSRWARALPDHSVVPWFRGNPTLPH